MSVKVTFEYAGAGTVPALRVRDPHDEFHRIRLQGGKGEFDAEVNVDYRLFWFVVGDPGTRYSIKLSTVAGHKVVANRNPIKPPGGVPSGGAGFGRERFKIEQGEAE